MISDVCNCQQLRSCEGTKDGQVVPPVRSGTNEHVECRGPDQVALIEFSQLESRERSEG